ncbi:MAG: DUF3089 domain-containing protein [Pseudomonadota bacterium]
MGRKFLLGIAILVGLAVIAAIGSQVFSVQLMRLALIPSEPFDETRVPPQPDYTDWSAWAVGDPAAQTPADLRPAGITYDAPQDVAIFYVHPTSYTRADNWNAAIDDPTSLQGLEELFISGQASVFAPYGRLYAPFYRQAALGAFLAGDDSTAKALQVAFGDVSRAFESFLERVGPNTPFILAGHSQGALHLLTLLHTHIQPRNLQDRMVAAYLIGWSISIEADLPATIGACDTANALNCVISWQTFAPDGDPEQLLDFYLSTPSFSGDPKQGTTMLCVNPVTFARNTVPADADKSLGGVPFPGKSGRLSAPIKNLVSVRCKEDGLLYMDRTPGGEFDNLIFPGGNYHPQDIQIFYRDVQNNLAARIGAYLRQ